MAGTRTFGRSLSGVGIVVEVEFKCSQHFRELQCPLGRTTQFVRHPDVAQAVDGETAGRVSHLERFDFAGIGSGETNHVVRDGVGNPDAVLLVDGESERPDEFAGVLQRIAGLVLAEELDLGRVALGKLHDLALDQVERPDISARRGDDALHLADLAVKVPPLGGRQRLCRSCRTS